MGAHILFGLSGASSRTRAGPAHATALPGAFPPSRVPIEWWESTS